MPTLKATTMQWQEFRYPNRFRIQETYRNDELGIPLDYHYVGWMTSVYCTGRKMEVIIFVN